MMEIDESRAPVTQILSVQDLAPDALEMLGAANWTKAA